jgi:SAM-dependent methyltransferase
VRAWNLDTNRHRAEAALRAVSDPSVGYPTYYTVPFHAYGEGNLGWLPAFECESATMSMALRVWKAEAEAGLLAPGPAQQRLRDGYLDALCAYRTAAGLTQPLHDIVDVGCSVGVSTQYLAARFPDARLVGIDLSPYFLAVATLRAESGRWGAAGQVTWRHADAEATGLPDGSVDFFSMSFVAHELPTAVTRRIMAEAFRVLRPGGVFGLTDNDPESPVIRGLPPVLFTLMKSTEPWSDEYYTMDMEGALRAAGFQSVETRTCDPRHRGVFGLKPL